MKGITKEELEQQLSEREKSSLLPMVDKHFPSAIVTNRQKLDFIKELDAFICDRVVINREE